MKKKMWFVLCIMTSVLLTTACGEKKEPGEEKKEISYHNLLVGILTGNADWLVKSNIEAGDRNSRADRNRI